MAATTHSMRRSIAAKKIFMTRGTRLRSAR
jgi:hypothetical protein